ncbi:hypothetical protein CGZ80_11845 [Rhodopirellula sp. MGV]|nr:hypothetical protein CGZ80_11845 [Rhodopirellula sp. MGV]PNY34488.1 DegT/DnrJ/EryC1/StrS aminotransferase family protein [Rhodopirellula baltica]
MGGTGTFACRLISSGSLGIELGLMALGVGPGANVAVCAYDYPGNFRAIELLGARPVLVDAALDSYSISPDSLRDIESDQVDVVIASHLYGVPAQVAEIDAICRDKGWNWVEDACQTPLMAIDGRFAGSHGDLGVLSFGGSKPLTAGNGGAILTRNPLLVSKLNARLDRPSDATPVSSLQAAALLPQLDRIAECNRRRADTVRRIVDEVPWIVESLHGICPAPSATCYKLAFLSPKRDHIVDSLIRAGLPVGAGFRSMHRSSKRRCNKIGELNRSAQLGDQVCLLDHRALLAQGDSQDRLIECLRRFS